MQTDMDQQHENSSASDIGYRAIEWTLDIKTLQLTIESDDKNHWFDVNKLAEMNHLPLFTRYMTVDKVAELKRCIKYVSQTGISQYLNCSLVVANQPLTYVELFIQRQSSTLLQGFIRPLIQLDSLREIAHLFEGIFDNHHHGYIITDDQTRVLACNRYFEQHSGYQQHQLLGKKANVFNANKHSKQFFESMWHDIHHHGFWSGSILNRRASGKVAPQELTIQKLKLSDGRIFFLGMTLNLENQLGLVADKSLGSIDLLTQLPIESRFKELLNLYYSEQKMPLTLIVLALQPQFKDQQTYSHMLMLSSFFTNNPHVKLTGYLGKGIYAICLTCPIVSSNTDFHHIQLAIKELMQSLKSDTTIHQAVTNGRIGVSVLGLDAKTPNRLVAHAMQAMLEQHVQGSRCISFYHSAMHQQAQRRKQLEDVVNQAIIDKDLEVYYQPIIETKTWKIVKFEALCRFKPVHNYDFTTQEMINIAEDLNLINELDKTVALLSLQQHTQIKQWFGHDIGLTINRSFNSNLSVKQILTNTLAIIDRYTDSPELITIELTENAYFDSQSKQAPQLDLLREKGVKIAIDDFGTGYSSFSYLSECIFDYLKIDRTFVTDIQPNSNKYHIVMMLVNLCHNLGIKVVAEGVESKQELEVLTSLGVDYMQGYFFAKPLPLTSLSQANQYHSRITDLKIQSPSSANHLTLLHLFRGKPHLDPSDPLSLVDKYFKMINTDALPVINQGECVGIVQRETLYLHLTPTMGTDLESLREAAIWRRPVNQIMTVKFTQLTADTKLAAAAQLVSESTPFPWVLTDGQKYKGIVTQTDVLEYLARQ